MSISMSVLVAMTNINYQNCQTIQYCKKKQTCKKCPKLSNTGKIVKCVKKFQNGLKLSQIFTNFEMVQNFHNDHQLPKLSKTNSKLSNSFPNHNDCQICQQNSKL